MPKPTAAADDTALPDPILSLLSRWKEANALFNSKPDDDSDEWARETYGLLESRMDDPPKASTAAGALAALDFAIVEQAVCINGYAKPFVARSRQFMTRFLSGPDPIFDAIAEHKRLWSAVKDAGDDDYKASGTETAYLDGMLRMVPATVPGLLAWLDYVLSEPGIGESDAGSDLNVGRVRLRRLQRHQGARPAGPARSVPAVPAALGCAAQEQARPRALPLLRRRRCVRDDLLFSGDGEGQRLAPDTFHSVNCVRCGTNNRGVVGYLTQADAGRHWNRRMPGADGRPRVRVQAGRRVR
ncbi:hypothetical protein [Xanthobacter sediminis]